MAKSEIFDILSDSKPVNGSIPTYLSHLGKSNPPQNVTSNQVGHRRLPATPKKPSTLYSNPSNVGFNNLPTQLTKPSSLALR